MSAAINPNNGVAPSSGRSQGSQTFFAKPRQEGLSISPECATARQVDLLTATALLILGLGFLAAACLFIAALVAVILA